MNPLLNKDFFELPNRLGVYHINKSETEFLYKEIFESVNYFQKLIKLNNESIIFDVGANIGLFSIFISQLYKQAKIYAFEPVLPIFNILESNISLHHLNAVAINVGIGDKPKKETITYYPNNSILSGFSACLEEDLKVVKTVWINELFKNASTSNVSTPTTLLEKEIEEYISSQLQSIKLPCEIQTISQVIEVYAISKIDLLKIDVEKRELDAIFGILEKDWHKIQQVLVEVHDQDNSLKRLSDFFETKGFHIFVEQENLLKNTNIYTIFATKLL